MKLRMIVAGLVAAVALGCGRSETVEVTGEVRFDGQPVPDGDILFFPQDGHPVPEPGKIEAGRYRLQAKPGSKKVQIRASKVPPGAVSKAGEPPIAENYIPSRYNSETTLTAEVTAGKVNELNFDLKAK
jgi:hypothetical protein